MAAKVIQQEMLNICVTNASRMIISLAVSLLLYLALPETACSDNIAPGPAKAPTKSNAPMTVPIAAATIKQPVKAETEFVWELDPYYTNVSLHIPLTDKPIPEITDTKELTVYKDLFFNSFVPKFMLVEASVMPMPLLGVAAKKYTPDFYRAFNIGSSDLNLLEAVTAGFQEPYAFSVFLGDMVSFVKPGEEKISSNKGYMGYMASYSNQHIKRNVLIPDHNLEVEWKLKGDRFFKDNKLSWSFRLGAKIHDNPNITNTYYLGFRRNNLDFKAAFLSFLDNSDINFRWDFSARTGNLIRQEYIIGKKYPIESWKVALRLDVGLIWEDPSTYSGHLRDVNSRNITAVIRPNIEF